MEEAINISIDELGIENWTFKGKVNSFDDIKDLQCKDIYLVNDQLFGYTGGANFIKLKIDDNGKLIIESLSHH